VAWFDLSNVEALRPTLGVADALAMEARGIVSREEVRLRAGFAGPAPEVVTAPDPTEEVDDDSEPGGAGGEGGGAGEGRRREAQEAAGQAQGRDRGQEVERRITLAEQQRRLEKVWKAKAEVVDRQEAAWMGAFRKLFNRQAESTLARLRAPNRAKRAPEGRATPDELFDPRFWQEQTAGEAEALNRALFDAAWTAESVRLGISFGLLNEEAVRLILERSNQLADEVTTTTYEAIKAQLAEGVEAGEGIDDLAKRIRSVFSDASAVRAETIARTEVIGGFNAATFSGLASLPPDVGIVGLEWIATADGRTRDTHRSVDGAAVWIGTPFQVGGASMLYPGDPHGPAGEVVNCRCTIGGLTLDAFNEKAELHATSAVTAPVPLETARVVLAMVANDKEFNEARVRRALEVAA